MTKVKNLLVALVFGLITFAAQAQQKVYVPYFEAINLGEGYQQSTTRLFKSYFESNKTYIAIYPESYDANKVVSDIAQVKTKALAVGAAYYLIAELNKVGDNVLVNMSLHNTVDGSIVWSDRLKAQSPNDLDPIIQRFAKNIGTTSASKDDNLYTVTDNESRELTKVQSNKYTAISIGSAFPLGKVNGSSTGLGIAWIYDARNLIMEFDAQAFWGKEFNLYQGSIEAYYPFSDKRSTPFIGGGLALSVSRINNGSTTYYSNGGNSSSSYSSPESKGGLQLLAGGGYLFNRTGSVGLRLTCNGFLSTYAVNSTAYYNNTNITTTQKYVPGGILLKLQIMFQR